MAALFSILVIDDDPNIADILNQAAKSTFIEARFIAVHSFVDAASYLEGLRGRGPNLILLDLDLQSELNGLDFLTLLRGHPQGRFVPVVMLSANQKPTMTGEAYVRGANAFTLKPFRYEDWKAYVGQLRTYWFATVTTPKMWFDNEPEE